MTGARLCVTSTAGMVRLSRSLCLMGLLLSLGGNLLVPSVLAQEGAEPAVAGEAEGAATAEDEEVTPPPPPPQLDQWNDAHSVLRPKTASVHWGKLAAILFFFVAWVFTSDWTNRDVQIHEFGYGTWNPVVFFPVMSILLLLVFPYFLPIPSNFPLALGGLTVGYLATIFPYVVSRNKKVEPHEMVLTKDWARYEVARLAAGVGLKFDAERKADYEKGAAVDLKALGGKDDQANQANLITARQSPGYLLVKELVADVVDRNSTRALLDYTQQAVVERNQIDGVWHNGTPRDRESGDVMLAVMKTLANLDVKERRKKQEGQFAATYQDSNYLCKVTTQGVKTGERVMFDLLGGSRQKFSSYSDLGMREKLAEKWGDALAADVGLVVISSVPEGGLTTFTDVSLNETDRLLRDFVAIEDVHKREHEIENIDVETYDSAAGETPTTLLPKLIRKYPNVYVVRDMVEPEAAKLLFDEVKDDHLVVTCVHAKDAPEALLRMLEKKVPHREFAMLVTAVGNVRLIRKLCETCRVAYEPSAELLKKLGIPAGKVEFLYRPPKGEEIDKPCPDCAGIGYKGRTGLFEVLIVNDKIREVLIKQPKLDLVRKAARLTEMRTHQEEGILLVAKGVTSIQELQRVLQAK